MRSARWPGWVMLSTSSVAASGSSGISLMTSLASFFRLMTSASSSTSSVARLVLDGLDPRLQVRLLLDELERP